MANTIKNYDAYLTYAPISVDQARCIENIFKEQDLLVAIDESALEFEFEGRDLSDIIVCVFEEVAKVLGNADGEIRCEIDDDGSQDPIFRFYTIVDGVLWEQQGKIVRTEKRVKSTPPSSEA